MSTLIPLGKTKNVSHPIPPIPSNLLSPSPLKVNKKPESSMVKLLPSYPSFNKLPSPEKISTLQAQKVVEEKEIKDIKDIKPAETLLVDNNIEQALLDAGFLPIEKILIKDGNNIMCRFIKARNKLGHSVYVELDCDKTSGYGFICASPFDPVLTVTTNPSGIPYSLKIGAFEANSDLYGIGFECEGSICTMSRKDPSLEPLETVFAYDTNNKEEIIENHNVPFPIVKMSEILANPKVVSRNIATSHARMRNVAFHSCMKEVQAMKKLAKELESEIETFDNISGEVSRLLSSTINELETMHEQYEQKGINSEREAENVKIIRFNLNKRQDLTLDHIALCHSMKERASKIKALRDELASLNEFSQTLFTGLSSVFTE